MVLKEEQERLQILLREAIPMMCKNVVPYETEFNIEALIGITVDRKEVFLVSINESIQNEASIQELNGTNITEKAEETEPQKESKISRLRESGSPRGPRNRKRRKRRLQETSSGVVASSVAETFAGNPEEIIRSENNDSDNGNDRTDETLQDLPCGDSSQNDNGASENQTDSAFNEYEPPPKSRPPTDPKERFVQDDDDGTVKIKEEPIDEFSDTPFPLSAQGHNASQMQSQHDISKLVGSFSHQSPPGQPLPLPQIQVSPLPGQGQIQQSPFQGQVRQKYQTQQPAEKRVPAAIKKEKGANKRVYSAERKRRWRTTFKSDTKKWEAYLERERERKKQLRKERTPEQRLIDREKSRERMRRYRERQKTEGKKTPSKGSVTDKIDTDEKKREYWRIKKKEERAKRKSNAKYVWS